MATHRTGSGGRRVHRRPPPGGSDQGWWLAIAALHLTALPVFVVAILSDARGLHAPGLALAGGGLALTFLTLWRGRR